MTDPDDDLIPPPRRRFRWLKRLGIGFVLVLVSVAIVFFAGRWQLGRVGERRLVEVNAGLDAAEPGWRLDTLDAVAQQNPVPEASNSAPVVLAAYARIPTAWLEWRDNNPTFRTVGTELKATPELIQLLEFHRAPTAEARAIALTLADRPRGRHAVIRPEKIFPTTLPHTQRSVVVASLLRYEAMLAAGTRDWNKGIRAARAALNAGRSLDGDVTLFSYTERMGCQMYALRAAFDLLARGVPTVGLPELQAAFQAEADEPHTAAAYRGQRAVIDAAFTRLERGEADWDTFFTPERMKRLGAEQGTLEWAAKSYRPLLRGDHAACLRLYTDCLQAALEPPERQRIAAAAIQIPPVPSSRTRYLVATWLHPEAVEELWCSLLHRASLRAAVVAIACERFRQAQGHWPNTLQDLVPGYIAAIPVGPVDGRPVRYRTNHTGIEIQYTGFQYSAFEHLPETGDSWAPVTMDLGWMLWNPEIRAEKAAELHLPETPRR